MNAPQFTPWFVVRDEDDDISVENDAEETICEFSNATRRSTRIANAHLIATAPDYDALAEKCEAFARAVIGSDPASRINIEANALIEEILRVRRRARGEGDRQ